MCWLVNGDTTVMVRSDVLCRLFLETPYEVKHVKLLQKKIRYNVLLDIETRIEIAPICGDEHEHSPSSTEPPPLHTHTHTEFLHTTLQALLLGQKKDRTILVTTTHA